MTDLEQIKQKIDIVALISEHVPLKKTGANFKGLCPFHSEKTPSFIVSPERQIWHCFGACQEGGDIFKFVMKIENVEFPEALKILALRAGVKLTTSYQASKTSELREKILTINHLASEFYAYILTSHPLGKKAREYLKSRQIADTSIKLFSLGYAPNSWESLTNFLTKKGYSTADLETAGLVSKSGIGHYFDRFRGRVMFTLKDQRGNVVGFAGRLLDPEAKEAKYVNTAETAVYVKGEVLYGLEATREEIKRAGFAVVVEGEIDAIASYQAGIKNVVAIKGSALTEGQVSLLKRYTENIYLSLDADYAGDAAAHRGIEMADRAGLSIKVVTFQGAKDPDELIKKGPSRWREAVEKAVSFYDFVIDSAIKKYGAETPEGAKRVVAHIAKFIEPMENLVVKTHYLKKIATKLEVPVEALETQLTREYKKTVVNLPKTENQEETEKIAKPRSEMLEEYLLSLLLQAPNPADYLLLIASRLSAEEFTHPALSKIYLLLVSLVENPHSDVNLPTKFDIASFVKIVPAELLDHVDRLYLTEQKIDWENDSEVLSEIQKTVWGIKELSLREKLRKLSSDIKRSAESQDLEREFLETTTALQRLLEERSLLRQGQL